MTVALTVNLVLNDTQNQVPQEEEESDEINNL